MKEAFYLSVIIPAFNEEKNIGRFLTEVKKALLACKNINQYEILVVDDHSDDKTFFQVASIREKNIHAIRLSKRSGSHIAIRAGFSRARGNLLLCLAADGQDDPRVISSMVEKIRHGSNIVWAIRKNRDEPFWQKFFAKMFYLILAFFTVSFNSKINLANADYYMIDQKVATAINSCPERNTSLFGLLIWLGFEQDFVLYERHARLSGRSKWNFQSQLRLALDWIIAFSGLPLKVISVMGIAFAALGFVYAIFIIVVYGFFGMVRPDWVESVITILIMGGAQMIMLGVLGEYLWRNLDESRRRPLFFIQDVS